MKKIEIRKKIGLYAIFIAIASAIFFLAPIEETLKGFYRILTCTSILLTDYLAVGGLAATLLNAFLTLILNLFIISKLRLKINGPIFACLLTIIGFSFFGKNLYNALPLYFGVYLYTKYSKTKLQDNIVVFLLSSGISPLVSYLMFGLSLSYFISIPLAIVVGIFIGFILPIFNKHTIQFHQGYNLYNTGFSLGVISMITTGIISSFGSQINREMIINNEYNKILLISIIGLSIFFIGYALFINKRVFKKYPLLLEESGRLFSDFISTHGKDVSYLNIGILGLFTSILVIVLKIQLNGPVVGAILTVIGFGAFGKHIRNVVPVMIGALSALFITNTELNISAAMAIIFVTGLAPIAGRFGVGAGIIAGFLHFLIVSQTLDFQGGFDLYNNGFAAGFVAAITSSLFEILSREVKINTDLYQENKLKS